MSLLRDYIDGRFRNEDEGEIGIGGFTTVARIRDNITQTREIPTTYLEDGSHVNDHIIHNPIVISIEGNVSDIHVKPSATLQRVRNTETIVGEVLQYAPARTQAQVSRVAGITSDIQQQVDRVDSAIRTGQNAAEFAGYTGPRAGRFVEDTFGVDGFAQDRPSKTNIERFIDDIEGYLYSDAPMTISGPVRTYEDMYITSFDYVKDNMSESLSFTLEVQQLRFTDTIFSLIVSNPAEETDGQHEGETNKGAQEGREVPRSLATSLKNLFF